MVTKLLNTLKVFLFFLSVFSLLAGCVSSQPPSGTKKSIWLGEITGMATGKMEITSWTAGENTNDQIIQGQLFLFVENAQGGHGDIKLKSSIKGRIKNGLMKVKISGYVEGATFMGDFRGTMSDSKGSGTWIVDVPDEGAGQYTGKWTLKKQ
jgi:hypothetical protein